MISKVLGLGLMLSLFVSSLALAEEVDGRQLVSEERVLMGTQVIVKVIGEDRAALDLAVEAAFLEVERLENLMSHYKPESQLSQINQAAGLKQTVVDAELFNLIQDAIHFSEMTSGAFDISFAAVGKLWNFRAKHVPSDAAIQSALPLVNYKEIRLDKEHSSVFLPKAGMEIGLGGIGKGYAMDRAMAILQQHGVHDAMVMAGGDTLIRGHKWGKPWRVGLRDPNKKDGILAILPLEDQAISTSGDYERFFIKAGKRYHHILDTRTGRPAILSRSVSILAENAKTSDALSTSVFVMGPQKGLALVESLEGVEAIVIDAEGKVHLSSGLATLSNTKIKSP